MHCQSLVRILAAALGIGLGASVAACGSGSDGTPPPPQQTFTYVGMVEGSNAFVGLAITGSNANLFFCGKGATLASQTHWIPGTVKSGEAFHFTDGVASATGSTTATHASGTFTPSASSQPLSWSADIVVSGTAAGIYDEQNSEGNAALTVIQPSASTAPIAQGAYLPNDVKDAIAQVTPFGKIYVSKQGVPVDVPINGSTKEWYLPPATGN